MTKSLTLAPAATVHEASDTKLVPKEYVGTIAPNYYCRGWNPKRVKYCSQRAGAGTNHPGTGRCKHHGGATPVTHGLRRRYELHNSPKLSALIEEYVNDPEPLSVLNELAVARALMHDWIDRYSDFVAALTAWYDTWEGRYIPISDDERRALNNVLDEYEQSIMTGGGPEPTDFQVGQLELARSAVLFLSARQEPKPRQILDVSDAMRHVDVISKIVTRMEQIRAHGTVSIDRLRMFLLALDRGLEIEVPDQAQRERVRRMIHQIRV